MDRGARIVGRHKKFARIALDEVADVPNPKILELGSGHGELSCALLKMHPTAHVTVTDIEPTSVAAIAAGNLGRHPRAVVREMDATAIDAPDGHYDLAVLVWSLHHLPPPLAARVFAEGTRAANKLLIIEVRRPLSLLHVLTLAFLLPFIPVSPSAHDGFIGSLRLSALRRCGPWHDTPTRRSWSSCGLAGHRCGVAGHRGRKSWWPAGCVAATTRLEHTAAKPGGELVVIDLTTASG